MSQTLTDTLNGGRMPRIFVGRISADGSVAIFSGHPATDYGRACADFLVKAEQQGSNGRRDGSVWATTDEIPVGAQIIAC